MMEKKLSKFEKFIGQVKQEEWDQSALQLALRIHEVDRQATRIWYSFWPLKLTRLLQGGGREAVIRDYRLRGEFELMNQIDSAISFLYGAKYWPQIKAEIVARNESAETGTDVLPEIEASAERVAKSVVADISLIRGITAVGYLMAAHVGVSVLGQVLSSPANMSRLHQSTPDKLCQQRIRQKGPGLFGFLNGAERKFRVRVDGHLNGGYEFRAFQGQDLSMASKSDNRDYAQIDRRRLEGPIPFECRSGSCGFCWVGLLTPPDRLEKITAYEWRRLKYFGYVGEEAPAEDHPLVRLSCQSHCWGDVQVVVSPWNGMLDGR